MCSFGSGMIACARVIHEPRVGAESGGGQAFAVHKIGPRSLVPREPDRHGLGDFGRAYQRTVFLKGDLGWHELAVFSRNLELVRRGLVPGGQPRTGRRKPNADLLTPV
jgi:hypothetical protein